MTNNEQIIFDPNCGISEEEQREIFTQINGIAEKNRHSLAATADERDNARRHPFSFTAKKSGSLFPLIVNAAAALALVGGFLVLSSFQGKTDAHVREGTKVYNTAERALIEEIRKDTSSRLEAKEHEISVMNSKIENTDAALQELRSGGELNEEQRATETKLVSQRNEYIAALAVLQDERSLILEESRSRESSLQAQLENRTRELAVVAEQSAEAIDLARNEMDRLSRDQAQAAAAEAQISALFANLNDRINEKQYDEAARIIRVLRAFINTPAFQGLRAIQNRRELYDQAISSCEKMLEDARRNSGLSALPSDAGDKDQLLASLQQKNAQLEQNLSEKDKTIAALSSNSQDNTAAQQRVTELEGSLLALRTMNNALEAGSAEKNNQIRDLQGQVNARINTINRVQQILQTGKDIDDMSLNEIRASLVQIQTALGN